MSNRFGQRLQCRELSARAKETIPGGASSYARTFDRELNWETGQGSTIQDVDGNKYVDYLQAWGAIILGHCNKAVTDVVSETLRRQDLYGYGTTELEVKVAETVKSHVPSAEKVLFGVTGSEVVAHAVRLARSATDRQKIVKFQGHYHGWYDPLAMNHLSDPEKIGTHDPFTKGLLREAAEETIVLPFNDVRAVEAAFEEHGDDIAGVVLEPIAHNMGCVVPKEGYLDALREITADHGSLLIFDEIITGFRHDLGGAQRLEGVTPDLTTLGKSVANGYPMSILCGKAEYMDQFTPAGGPVAFGGTYNAHAGPLAAAKKTIELLEKRNFHANAVDYRDRICNALEDIIEDRGLTATVEKYGTVFLTYFQAETPTDYVEVLDNDIETYMKYRWRMMDQGILMVPKNARRNYITDAHDEEDARRTIEAATDVLAEIANYQTG